MVGRGTGGLRCYLGALSRHGQLGRMKGQRRERKRGGRRQMESGRCSSICGGAWLTDCFSSRSITYGNTGVESRLVTHCSFCTSLKLYL